MDYWACEVISKMRQGKITQRKLAEHLGYSEQWVSTILNGQRTSEKAKNKIIGAINEILGIS